MECRIVFHPKAEAELEQLYDDIAERASPAIAWDFVVGIRDLCLGLSTFPQRGRAGGDHAGWLRIVARSVSFSLSTASSC
ncbi:type II toxin-antitoxin system RelE/ParE family toxin [Mesorhizobium sp. CA16]|uniref:type II toxin-antitoxin system RelE/ParE family toxin n=1 Tax=Mesorhizobium sp. CA16 TaxID=588496 RepID=UPI001CC96250|nr:type II toxin-antitoxin system RelE/ParE family toxin [Mesorhizobium sp. CA16]MBZ9914386.1 type II toxin-antitoxin system RelE/ParE family toxin [Mesorhizobium sp. CA16]